MCVCPCTKQVILKRARFELRVCAHARGKVREFVLVRPNASNSFKTCPVRNYAVLNATLLRCVGSGKAPLRFATIVGFRVIVFAAPVLVLVHRKRNFMLLRLQSCSSGGRGFMQPRVCRILCSISLFHFSGYMRKDVRSLAPFARFCRSTSVPSLPTMALKFSHFLMPSLSHS